MTLVGVTIHGATYVRLPGGDSDNTLSRSVPGRPQRVHTEPLELRSTPTTIGEFQVFIQCHEA